MRIKFGFLVLAVFSAALLLAGCRGPHGPGPGTVVFITPNNDGGARVEVSRGGGREFTATLAAGVVDWSVGGNFSAGTVITPSAGNPNVATLNVAALEIAQTLTITAAARHDAAVFAAVVVTLTDAAAPPPPPPTVTNVTVDGPNIVAHGSANNVFTATVTGTNNPPQTVTWSVIGSVAAGTAIGAGTGVLTVASGETATSLIVRAASTVNPSVTGERTVLVQDVAPLPPPTNQVLDAYGVANWNWNHPSLGGYLGGFQLRLYGAATETGPFMPVGLPISVGAAERSRNLAQTIRTAGVGTYRFTVSAVSNNQNRHPHSGPSAHSNTQNITRRDPVVHVWWYAGDSGLARWVNPDGPGSNDERDYRIRLFRNGVFVKETVVARHDTANIAYETRSEFNFALAGLTANSGALYSFSVVALRRDDAPPLEADSEPSGESDGRNINVMGIARVWTIAEGGTGANLRYVAGGAGNGRIAWSADGENWTLANTGEGPEAVFDNNAVRAIAHSPGHGSPGLGRFVAVGHGGNAAFSDNGGATWTRTTSNFGTAHIFSLAYGGGVFVAGGAGGNVRHSNNGTAWNSISGWADSTILDGGDISAMMFSANTGFVAFATNLGNWGVSGQHAHSATGVSDWTWIENQIESANRDVLGGVVGTAGTFVVTLANEGHIPRFTGLPPEWTWSDHQVGYANILSVGYGHGRFIAVGRNGQASVSADNGANWTPLPNPFEGYITAARGMPGGRVILAGPGLIAVMSAP